MTSEAQLEIVGLNMKELFLAHLAKITQSSKPDKHTYCTLRSLVFILRQGYFVFRTYVNFSQRLMHHALLKI
jgi:hypothetical protein